MSCQDTVIYHLFADHGAEGEALTAYGDVHRFTIDPEPNDVYASTTQMDLMAEMPDGRADLVVCHPKCTRWSDMPDVVPENHENQIDRARKICEEVGEHYIIENKPRAPLRDPVTLTGKQFGLPIKYERAFETSFAVRTPPQERELPTECSPYFSADRTREWWASVKQVHQWYPKEHLAKNTLPLPYIHLLMRSWLRVSNDTDSKVAQDNNGPAPRTVSGDQATLESINK